MTQDLKPNRTDREEGNFSQDGQIKVIKTVNYEIRDRQDGQIQGIRAVDY